MYRVIPDEDYDQIIIPRFSRIFDPYIYCWFEEPFTNPSWEAVLIPKEIYYCQIDKDDEYDVEYCYQYVNHTVEMYIALLRVIESRNQDRIFVAGVPFILSQEEKDRGNQRFAATINSKSLISDLINVRKKEKLWPYFALCDETETWGYANHIDHFSFLGGTPEFMESFFALCGGREAVRQTFHKYDISTGFPYSFEDGAFPAWHRSFDDPNVPRTETVREFVYHSVGWEAPLYTEEEIRNHFYGLGPDDPTPPYPQDPFRG